MSDWLDSDRRNNNLHTAHLPLLITPAGPTNADYAEQEVEEP